MIKQSVILSAAKDLFLKSRIFATLRMTILLTAIGCVSLNAADDKSAISVKSELNRAFITIGDPVEYTITVKHDPSIKIVPNFPAPDLNVFKIKKVQDINKKEGESVVEGRKYILTTYSLGDYVLDPVTIQYHGADGNVQSLSTEKLFLSVKSVAAGEQKVDIRGVKSVLALVAKFSFWILLILLVAGLGAFLFYKFRKQQEALPATPETKLSAEEQALQDLNKLFDSDLLRKEKVKEYYLRLSEILRIYFEKRFEIAAIESTTDEIFRDLVNKSVDGDLRRKIREVLEAADLAKFAKWKPEPAQIIALNQDSKKIIEMARPAPVVNNAGV